MNFLGKNVRVQRILLQGREIHFDIAFVDDEGIVHATTKHSITDAPPDVRKAAMELVGAISEYSNQIHFGGTPRKEKRATGIAEAFSGAADPAENPEGQG